MAYGVVAIILLVVLLFTTLFRNSQQINNIYNPELARAMEYQKVNEGDDKVDEAGYVKFDAFFLRDLDNDGYADKIRGTCREITATDTLYINLNVLTNGTLEEGKIEIQGQNINFKTAIVDDNVIEGNYISENTTSINLKNVEKGTQKLIYGTIKAPSLGTDTKKYSSDENKIILTGTHKKDDGTTTTIRKEVTFTVDWYASVSCSIYDYTGYHTGAQDIEQVIDEENRSVNLSFYIETREEKELAILQSSYLTGKIPPLNGHMPDKVEITGTDITFDYEDETGEFTAKREAVRDEGSKIVTKTVSRYNTYRFNVVYPIEAYEEMESKTISIQVPLEAYYEGYNNEHDEFEHPVKSNVVTRTLSFLWRKLEGEEARFDVTVGKYRTYYEDNSYRYEYVVSKKKPLNIYNGISETEIEDYYTVRWDAYTGSAEEIYGIKMQEPTEDVEGEDEDRFLDSENNFYDMSSLSKNVGIYFSGADTILGENGKIEVYDAEEGKLINTFTSANWNMYDSENPYRYETPITHIRIQTSKANKNSSLTVYNIKEIDDTALIEKFQEKPQFDKLQSIYSYLDGYIKTKEEGEEYKNINTDTGEAIYEAPISVASIEVARDTYGTQREEKDINITIKTISSYYNMEGWTNGRFLVELPEGVLDVKINSVTPSEGINILAYEINEIEGQKFIQIETENQTPANYDIVINCDITADPRMTTQPQDLQLYAINENCENYKNSKEDTHDVDGDVNTQEQVCYAKDIMYFVSPSSLLTNQEASEYNDKKEKAVAPQIATIDKTEANTAKINVSITNNYGNTISEVKIVGKIPTKNNTFVINKGNLGSTFDTTMEAGGITVPTDLKSYVTVYYSGEENVTADLTDTNNHWDKDLNPTQAKSYLIDLGEYRLKVEEKKEFSYTIKVPETVQYNDISYSTHAVYFCLDTTGGKFKTETETSKLGFRIERKYNLNLQKLKEGTNTPVQGAVFAITEVAEEARNGENTKEGKIGTTNEKGTFTIQDLYVDKTYVLKEIRTPSSYEKNSMEYKFKVTVSEDNDNLELEEISNEGNIESPTITQPNDGQRGVLNVTVTNIAKYQMVLTKKEQTTEEPIPGVRYNLKGENLGENGITISTNKEGKITISGLSREKDYTLTEVSAKGYYLMGTPIIFKLTNTEGELKLTTTQGEFKPTPNVTVGEGVIGITAQDKVEVELEDEKIPTYSITLKKYASDKEAQALEGAQYKIEGDGIEEGGETYTTGKDGTVTIEGLYEYVATKPQVTGKYTITEIAPPEGYRINTTPLVFYVQKDAEQKLELKIESGEELIRLVPDLDAEGVPEATKQDVTIAESNIQIGLIDDPLFKLTKKEKETTLPIPNTKFKIVEISDSLEEIGPAKDVNNKEIGEEEQIDGKIERVVTTNEEGVISYGLKSGLYKAIEIQAADGYVLPAEEQRTYYFGIDKSKEQETEQGVAWANEVASNRWNKVESAEKTADEGVVTVGYFTGELDLNGDNEADITAEDKTYSGFIAKYAKDGTLEFAKAITSGYETKAKDVIVTQAEEYIVVGYFGGKDLKVDESSTTLTNETKYKKGFVIKLAKNGDYSWAKEIADESKNTNAVSVIEDNGRNIIVGVNTSGEYKSEYDRGYMYYYDGNPKIIKYTEQGEKSQESTIESLSNIEDMAINSSGDGAIIISSNKTVSTSSTKGRIDTYNDGEVTPNMTTDFNPVAITKLTTEKYIIVGNYMGTVNEVESKGSFDGVIAQYSDVEKELSNYKFIKGGSDDIITSVEATSDDGFLVGAYTHSGKVTFTDDDTNQISSRLGNTDALIIKYDEAGNYVSHKQMQGSEMEEITDIVEIKENEYIAVGYFNSEAVSADLSKPATDLELSQYTDGFVLRYGEKIIAPAVPEKSEIEIENELKEYTITTEVKQLEGKEKGGTITGDGTGKPVETVQHGKDSQKTIEVTPDPDYKILSITVNDEEYPFTPDGEGHFTFPTFEKMTSNKHIVVTFSNTVSSVTVHHYLDGTQSEAKPTEVAPDETKVGEIGTNYTTEPHTDLDKYELKKNEDGQYELPAEKSGQFTKEPKTVTYLYVEKKVPLIVHHYVEGTENHVELADGTEATDITEQGTEETQYNTQALKPYNAEEAEQTKMLAEKYELAKTPLNAEGTYKYPKVEVTYQYKIKTYNIITKVKTHEETDEYGQSQQVKGGNILGEDVSIYETVEHGKSNTQKITATPEENYVVKSIKLNGTELQEGTGYDIDGDTGSITLKTITDIKEDKTIEVEFEKIPTSVIVHHYIYNKATKQETETPVKLLNGGEVQANTITGHIGDMYVTQAIPNEELQEGYELYKEAENGSGYMAKDPIEVKYYYALKDVDMVQSVVKDGTQIITSKDEELNYTIKYTAQIKSYKGNAKITIVDTLPYALDKEKMKEIARAEGQETSGEDEEWLKYLLNGGEYEEKNDEQSEVEGAKIYTITWHDTEQGIETQDVELEEIEPIEIVKNIRVVFKGISTTEPQSEEEKIFTNKVKATIELDATAQQVETQETTHDTKKEFTKNVKVTKTWDDNKNIYGRPSKLEIQIKEQGKEQEQPVATYELSAEDNWTHIFTGLRKYDDEGNEITYIVEEKEAEGESLEYYEREIE